MLVDQQSREEMVKETGVIFLVDLIELEYFEEVVLACEVSELRVMVESHGLGKGLGIG